MKYPNARKDLIEALESFMNLFIVKSNRQDIILSLQDRVDLDLMTSLFNKNQNLNLISSKDTLYFILVGLQQWYNSNEKKFTNINTNLSEALNPEKYFTDFEIEECKALPIKEVASSSDTFTLHGVIQVTPEMFSIPRISAQEIQALLDSTLIRYDFSMQRESEKKKSKFTNEYYETIKIFDTSMKEIEEKMLKKKYTPTAISINILRTENTVPHFVFDEEKGTITLSKLDRNSLIDGMHRCGAIINALMKDKNLIQYMQLNIFNYNLTQAREFIYQEGQKNPIPKSVLKGFNSEDPSVRFINELINFGTDDDNLLVNRIGIQKTDVTQAGRLTTVDKLVDALNENFHVDLNDFKAKRSTMYYLVNFFNLLLSSLNEQLDSVVLSRKTSVALNPNMFYAYFKIASLLYNNTKTWPEDLEKVLDALNFDKASWDTLGMKRYDIKATEKQKLYAYIEDIVKQNLAE